MRDDGKWGRAIYFGKSFFFSKSIRTQSVYLHVMKRSPCVLRQLAEKAGIDFRPLAEIPNRI